MMWEFFIGIICAVFLIFAPVLVAWPTLFIAPLMYVLSFFLFVDIGVQSVTQFMLTDGKV